MMKEEITKVLEMVQAGTISADEGQQLLEAMGAYDEPKNMAVTTGKKARKLYVRVNSSSGDKVNIALPLGLVKTGLAMGLNMGNQYSGNELEKQGIDMEQILKLVDEMADSGETGDIVNVQSSSGDTVHILME